MKRPALQNKQVVLLRMAFRAQKVLGTFEKRALEQDGGDQNLGCPIQSFLWISDIDTNGEQSVESGDEED